MARDLQNRVLAVLEQATNRRVYPGPTPAWLQRPGRAECGLRWRVIRRIYRSLSDGLILPAEMPLGESRTATASSAAVAVRSSSSKSTRDSTSNVHRSSVLAMYPTDIPLGFPMAAWVKAGDRRVPSAGGGWGAPKPPLFPMAGGRHRQRAFRDALADLLPDLHGYGPTIRIADFEVEPWIWDTRGAAARLAALIEGRLVAVGESPGRSMRT